MEFFKFTGKNKALIMAENEEEAIELFEYRIAEFDDEEEIGISRIVYWSRPC